MPHRQAFRADGPRAAAGVGSSPRRAVPLHEPSRAGAIAVTVLSVTLLASCFYIGWRGEDVVGAIAARIVRSLGTSLGMTSRRVEVVSDSQTIIVPMPAARGFVAGRVLHADGGSVAGRAVRVRSEARPGWDWVASSGADGSFHVEGVPLGKLRVSAEDIEAGFVESPLLELDEAHDVVLVLDRTVEISGVVLDSRGAPLARAAVRSVVKPGAPDRIVVTDDDGRFTLHGSARNIERLTAWARGFDAASVTVSGPPCGALERTIRLRASRPVHGVVVDAIGNAIPGARVSACAGKEIEVATTDRSGTFQLPATAIGCSVTAHHPRFAGARPIRIGDHRDLRLRLGAGGAIEGTAVDERGKPIGLFSVTIGSVEAREEGAGTASRAGEKADFLRGTFEIDDLAPGTYVLQVSAPGMVDAQTSPIEVGRGSVVRGEQIVLSAAESGADGESGDESKSAEEGAEAPRETSREDEPAEHAE